MKAELGMLAVCVLGGMPFSALADCPSGKITGTEDGAWLVTIDVSSGSWYARSGAARKTADVQVTCQGNIVFMQQSNANDNNSCYYRLVLNGKTLSNDTYQRTLHQPRVGFQGQFQ